MLFTIVYAVYQWLAVTCTMFGLVLVCADDMRGLVLCVLAFTLHATEHILLSKLMWLLEDEDDGGDDDPPDEEDIPKAPQGCGAFFLFHARFMVHCV